MRLMFCAGLCLASLHLQAEELVVRAGQAATVAQERLQLKRLVLEDGAQLHLAPGLKRLQLSAEQAWIGRDVQLLARGAAGSLGVDGGDATAAADCQVGLPGEAGGTGGAGSAGAELELSLGIRAFGSLMVDTRGGAGGSGGRGGKGGMGGDSTACVGAAGGQGGAGGEGGQGGAGGNVTLRYWALGDTGYIPFSNYGPGIRLETAGGAGANSGEAGEGGRGGAGKTFKRSSGAQVVRDGGVDGKAGAAGRAGLAGKPGAYLVQPLASAQH